MAAYLRSRSGSTSVEPMEADLLADHTRSPHVVGCRCQLVEALDNGAADRAWDEAEVRVQQQVVAPIEQGQIDGPGVLSGSLAWRVPVRGCAELPGSEMEVDQVARDGRDR